MIDLIQGNLVYKEMEYIVVQTGGIGYRIFCTDPFQWEEGSEVQVYTHQVVREDALYLYGFRDKQVRDLFRLLLEVSGIGPKVALSITGAGSPVALADAIQREDLRFLTKIPGIGKKTGQRIILDLKDKLEKKGWNRLVSDSELQGDSPIPEGNGTFSEVIDALKALGYNEEEAEDATRQAKEQFLSTEELGLDEWIRRALQVSMKR